MTCDGLVVCGWCKLECQYEVSKPLRHANIRVTAEVYTHLLPDQLQATVRVLDRDKIVTFVMPDQEEKDVG
jgi:hypothetical protein